MYHRELIDYAIMEAERGSPFHRAVKLIDIIGSIPSTKIDKLRYVSRLFNITHNAIEESNEASSQYKEILPAQNYNFIKLLIELIPLIPGYKSDIEMLRELENLDNSMTYQPQIFTIDLITQPSNENSDLLEKKYRQWLIDSWYMFLKSDIGGYFEVLPRDISKNYISGTLIELLNDYKYNDKNNMRNKFLYSIAINDFFQNSTIHTLKNQI